MAGTFCYEDSFIGDDTWDSSLDDGVMYGVKEHLHLRLLTDFIVKKMQKVCFIKES